MSQQAHPKRKEIKGQSPYAVSVIVPAYNAESTIAETLESLLAQSCPDWEAIVVDDGSIDLTPEIARQFGTRDPRIRLVQRANGGEAAARNTGIGHASYDWLLFLDSDDWIAPRHIERMTTELVAHPELDAVHCGSIRVAGDGTYVSDDYRPPAGDLFPTLACRAAFPVHACIVRKSVVEAVGKFDTSLKKSPDWDLWQRVARTGSLFGAVPEVLAYYRMVPHSASLDAEQLLIDGLTVLRRGHSPDPRVPKPHPDYTLGLPRHAVESQEFYLLCWSAGLLLGAGKDARPLLRTLNCDHYTDLYPDAIAKCIFEAAILPSCHAAQFWENLWPELHQLTEQFLIALETQSRTPDLARHSSVQLRKLVLKNSPTWGPVIAEQEQAIERQKVLVEDLDRGRIWSEGEREKWKKLAEGREQEKALFDKELQQVQKLANLLEGWNSQLTTDLGNARQQVTSHEHTNAVLAGNLAQSYGLIERLAQEKGTLEAVLEQARRNAGELAQHMSRLEADLSQARSLAEGLAGELEQWRRNAGELAQHKSRLEADLSQARSLAEGLAGELEQSRRNAGELAQHKSRLEADLSQARSFVEGLARERTDLQRELEQAHRQARELIQHAEGLALEKTSLQSDLEKARDLAEVASLEKMTFAPETLAEDLAGARDRADELTSEKTRLQNDLSEARALVDALAQENAGLHGDLERVTRQEHSLQRDLARWEQLTGECEFVNAKLQEEIWVRLGLKLRVLKQPSIGNGNMDLGHGPMAVGNGDSSVKAPAEFTQAADGNTKWELHTAGGNQARLVFPPDNREPGRVAIEKVVTKTPWDIQLNQRRLGVKSRHHYRLHFRARADRRRTISVGFSKGSPPWNNLGLYRKIHVRPEWQSFQIDFVVTADDDNGRIHFDVGRQKIAVEVSAIVLRDLDTGRWVESDPNVEVETQA